MRTLHVAAMPFPTQQGTQALLHSMLSALAAAGHDSHLLCYGHGAYTRHTRYRIHRPASSRKPGSLRSGPSLEKFAQDALMVAELRRLVHQLRPELIVAHHVEAALAALLAGVQPVLFVAHTSLSAELASYFPAGMSSLCQHAGRRLDRFLCRRVARVVAVSPLLAQRLIAEADVPVWPLQLPWEAPADLTAQERVRARTELALAAEHEVVLYAGNLDAYQGLPSLAAGLASLAAQRPQLRWLVATQSMPAELQPLLDARLEQRVIFSTLANQAERRRVHAAADLVVVPRGSAGGIAIKLLDALARGVPVVATRRALAGLPLAEACTVIEDDDPGAWLLALGTQLTAHDVPNRGREYVRQAHQPARFVADFLRHVEACQHRPRRRVGFFRSAIDE